MNKENERNLFARANAILKGCEDKVGTITNLKLQKLLYLSYIEHIRMGGSELDYLKFEAWKYGPVNRGAYDMCKSYGYYPIETTIEFENERPLLINDDSITRTLEKYANKNAFYLVNETHDDAWLETIKAGENQEIKYERIKNLVLKKGV